MNAAEARMIADQANTPRPEDKDAVSEALHFLEENIRYRARRGYTTYEAGGISAKPDTDIKCGATAKAIRKQLKELGFKIALDPIRKTLEIKW